MYGGGGGCEAKREAKRDLEVVENYMKELGLASGTSCMEKDCGRHVLTKVGLEFPWDSPDEQAVEWCVSVALYVLQNIIFNTCKIYCLP